METLGTQNLFSFVAGEPQPVKLSNKTIRHNDAIFVHNYFELATKIATLQYLNRDYVLMFRGQEQDYKNRNGNTSLRPTIARGDRKTFDYDDRFRILQQAEQLLVREFTMAGFRGGERLKRQRILRWSILQHYEVCRTPLLDVTHSLRIASSFASQVGGAEAFLFVLALPNLSGAVTASAEAGLQVVRLSSVCPPEAVRPHIQEGYLLGEYPDLDGVEQQRLYESYETDFGLRLIGKFKFNPRDFWASSLEFPRVGAGALYPPSAADPLRRISDSVKSQVSVT